jgi:hypothetical protein
MMRMLIRLVKPFWILCFGVVIAALLVGPQPSTGQRISNMGNHWLKWNNERRQIFVGAYLFGYLDGLNMGCEEGSKDSTREPERLIKCENRITNFSKDSQYYVDSLTEFYNKYPEEGDIYPEEILAQLGRGLTLEQIRHYPFLRRTNP